MPGGQGQHCSHDEQQLHEMVQQNPVVSYKQTTKCYLWIQHPLPTGHVGYHIKSMSVNTHKIWSPTCEAGGGFNWCSAAYQWSGASPSKTRGLCIGCLQGGSSDFFWKLIRQHELVWCNAVDGSEIPNNHLGCINPLEIMRKSTYQLVRDFFHQQYCGSMPVSGLLN